MEIPQLRLLNQHISLPSFAQPADVVSWLVAVQAQDYAGAKWALGLRMQAAADGDIEAAFMQGSILRTHLLRPTWHFVTPADIRWILALTAPRVHAVNAYQYRRLELDSALFSLSTAALEKALQGGNRLTREELRSVLEQAGIATQGELRLGYILMRAELDGMICSGGRRGKQFTYMLLEERVPQTRTLERDEALAELIRRYFISRGPATVQDFAKWSGLTVTDARRGLAEVQAQLQQEIVDGKTYWLSTSPSAAKQTSPTAYLLSIYDEYISGYNDRSAIAAAEHGAKLLAMGNDLQYIIIIDGQIVGTWKRTLSKDRVTLKANFFNPLSEADSQAVATAARQYGKFLELPAVLA